ncbi:SDR family oxidoreductase [Henriciella pelagia]|jgi:NAD(P)-dependent dehydrogenase (short-subunit alcohol dehydrogenase family)|uniref:SDR family oxidoreductase n=1 Tax=Henriciella pelagia TaxID=1977912 RepID=UPI003512816F
MTDPAAIIIGAGDATGGAIARRFAREGLTSICTRRTEEAVVPLVDDIRVSGRKAIGIGCDARDEDQMVALFDRVEQEVGPVEVMVFNIGANVRFPITETTARVYRKVWEMAAFAGFLAGREAARVMLPRGAGTIIFTGATASMRGAAGFSAFAGAKFALRALAQSMARELGPKGIHVAHAVIDGAIDTAFIRDNFPDRYALKDHDGILNPEAIADAYWMLHTQERSAWTHELDLRPWMESF